MSALPNLLPAQKSAARMAAVQALYLIEITGQKPDKVTGDFLAGRIPAEAGAALPADFDRELFTAIVHECTARREEVDAALSGSLDAKWPLERLEKILRALLRAGVTELLSAGVDGPIVINDYINVAHGFFSGKEPALVNAVLDKVSKNLHS